MYERIKHDRLYEGVVAQIQQRIISGQLKQGDRLPTETELAEQFGVSRSAIREAMKILAAKGLIEISPGRGTFVTGDLSDAVAKTLGLLVQMEPKAFEDLHTIRNVLEVANARMAAVNRGGVYMAEMDQTVETMGEVLADSHTDPQEDMERYVQADLDFHNCLAKATGNSVAVILVEAISDLLRTSRYQIISVPDSAQKAQDYHRQIYEQVGAGCPEGAGTAMEEHLKQVADDMKVAIKQM
jgi:GntR family transcriptional repressor for pyruvate dehydrogenase complex